MGLKKLVVLAFLIVAACLPVAAQTITGAFTGTLTDPSGAVLPNVKITATNTATNLTYNTASNSSGVYSLLFLPVGEYNLITEASGFKKSQLGPFRLEVNQVARVDVKMEVGDTTQSVEVTGAPPVLQTESTQTGDSLSSSKLTSLPLNGRNFAALTLLIPGAITTNPQMMNTSARVQGSGSRPFVNGNREQTNNFLLDGVDVNDSIDNRIAYQPNVDALEEVRVVTGNAAADYGNAGGAVVVMSMKSGTNQLHGNVFEFLRNNALDANGFFRNRSANTAKRQGFRRNIFGGTLGGPIVRNRAFFFVDYEGTIQREDGPSSANVAPEQWRRGDLSQFPNNIVDPTTGQPFPNKQIPLNRITNPAARALFSNPSLYPLPNQAGAGGLGVTNNYAGSNATKTDNHQADAKGDLRLTDKDNLSARWSIGRYEQIGINTVALPTQMYPGANGPTTSAVLNWTRTVSPTIVNEARVAYSRFAFDTSVIDWSGLLGADGNQKVGIPGGQPFAGMSLVNIGSGLTPLGSAATIESTVDNKIMYYDNLTWQKGRHLLKMGGQFTRYQQNRYYAGNNGALGSFTYSGTYSGLEFADFLLDALNSKGRGAVVGKWGQRSWRSALFVQDDFKVTPTLTLNLGLRWEYMQPLYEVADRQVNVNTFAGQVLYPGQNGNSRALYNGYWKQFMPRFGFAWTPSALNNKLVLRGGYAYMSFMEGTGANLRLPLNPPFFVESNLTYDPRTPGTITTGFADVITQNVTLNSPRPPGVVNPQLQGRAWDLNLRPQTTQQINLSVEYLFDNATSITAGYVGQRGRHLVAPHEANQPLPGTGPFNTWANQETRRPLYNILPNLGNIALTEASATMDYNSLQVSGRRRFAQGLEFLASYTFGKTLTDNAGYYGGGLTTSEGAYWQNSYDRRSNRGAAFFDVTHNFTIGGLYSLPYGTGRKHTFSSKAADLFLGGWGINYFAAYRTGFPITFRGVDRSGQAVRGNVRANRYRELESGIRTVDDWFGLFPTAARANPFCVATGTGSGDVNRVAVDDGKCAYGQASDGAFGNNGIGTERGPSYFSMDTSVGKRFNMTERQYFDFRVEFFNVLNHASWANPSAANASIQNVGTFGNLTQQVQAPRSIQFGLKYIF